MQVDVEEVILDENEAAAFKPDRDCQPPRVNTFFGEGETQKSSSSKQRKQDRKQRKAIAAMEALKTTPKAEEGKNDARGDVVVMIDSSFDGSENDEQESFVRDLTKNLISNTMQRFTKEVVGPKKKG